MSLVLKRFLLFGLVVGVIWLGVVVYWQTSQHTPTETDMLLYLVVAPLVMAGALWGGYKLFSASPAAAAAPQADGAVPASTAGGRADAVERTWTLHVLATSLRTSAGASASDVLSALTSGEVQLALDSELKNQEGYPIFAARVPDLDTSEFQDTFGEWLQQSPHATTVWTAAQYRAMLLATQSVDELSTMAGAHPAAQQFLAAQARPPKEDAVPYLRIMGLFPVVWPESCRQAAADWLKFRGVQNGWPAHRVLTQVTTPEITGAMEVMDALVVNAHRTQLPMIAIVLACDSAIDQELVDDLAARSALYGGKNMTGSCPGEAVAALLLADAAQSQLISPSQETCSRIHRAAWSKRDKSADERGRVSADVLTSVVASALEAGALTAADVKLISADNDHKPARESELSEMASKTFRDLDLSKDVVKVAQACGTVQHVGTVAALCLAHQHVVDEQAPSLCASLHDPFWRAAVVLTAPTDPAAQVDPTNGPTPQAA